jgi:hypothetical protein
MSTEEIIGLIAIALLVVIIFSLVAANSFREGRRKSAVATGGSEGVYGSSGSDGGANCSPGDSGGSCGGDGGGGGGD